MNQVVINGYSQHGFSYTFYSHEQAFKKCRQKENFNMDF